MLFDVIGYDSQVIGQVEAGGAIEAWNEAGKRHENVLDVRQTKEWYINQGVRFSNSYSIRLSKYELTNEGEGYYNRLYYLGMSKRTVQQNLEFDILDTVKSQPKPDIEGFKRLSVIIPEFESKGYIIYREVQISELLNRIRNPKLRKDLTIYSRIAQGEHVSDNEIDYLFGKLLSGISDYWESLPKLLQSANTQHILTTKVTISLARDAKTRSDKVIAIDSMMSIHHDIGFMSNDTGYLFPDLYDLEEDDIDFDTVGRVLNTLAGD